MATRKAAKRVAREHDPGGKVRLKLPAHVVSTAVFGGRNEEYRYRLHRTWGPGRRVLFVMMNPSTATPEVDDPTVAKCRRYAVAWGFDGMDVGNVFAYRATDQKKLKAVKDPVGPENDAHLLAMAKAADLVVFAYGKPGSKELRERGPAVARAFHAAGVKSHVLALSLDGTPKHPLYQKDSLTATAWELS